MTGKEKCQLLREIRKEIAEANGIVYLTAECTNEDCCTGTCPKCDAEIRYLDSELNRLAREGKNITVSGVSFETLVDNTDDSVCEAQGTEEIEGIICGEHYVPDWKEGVLCITIEELDFSDHTAAILKKHNLLTVEDIYCSDVDKLLEILPEEAIREIKLQMTELGLYYDDED